MKVKEQIIYDINSEQFKYLQKGKDKHTFKVDINDLNKRLNETKKTSFYTTTLVVIVCFSFLTALALIGIKF
jgi:hypothetical protein